MSEQGEPLQQSIYQKMKTLFTPLFYKNRKILRLTPIFQLSDDQFHSLRSDLVSDPNKERMILNRANTILQPLADFISPPTEKNMENCEQKVSFLMTI